MADAFELSAKSRLRQLALRSRAALSESERAAKSARIVNALRLWEPYRRARTLCLYASFGSEVQTMPLLEACAQGTGAGAAGDGLRIVCLPRVQGTSLVLHRLPWLSGEGGAAGAQDINTGQGLRPADGSTKEAVLQSASLANASPPTGAGALASVMAGLVRSPMGMPEPLATWSQVRPEALDLVLVPGSAFSVHNGHRLGYGKGFYDRLLAQAPQALKVGLCFDVQLFAGADFPSDPHDVALDALVTESGIRDLRKA